MQVKVSSRIELGKNADKSVVCFTLTGENDTEKALLHSIYGWQGNVSTCVPFTEIVFSRKVDVR